VPSGSAALLSGSIAYTQALDLPQQISTCTISEFAGRSCAQCSSGIGFHFSCMAMPQQLHIQGWRQLSGCTRCPDAHAGRAFMPSVLTSFLCLEVHSAAFNLAPLATAALACRMIHRVGWIPTMHARRRWCPCTVRGPLAWVPPRAARLAAC
jgi:hypothetical protein